MAVLIDTDTVPEEERAEFWSDQFQRTFFNTLAVHSSEDSWRRRMAMYTLGQVRVYHTVGAGHSAVSRTPATIADDDPEYLSLMLLVRGQAWQTQGDNSCVLTAGDAVCHDSSRPYSVQTPTPFEMLIFAFPKALLHPHVDRVCAKAGTHIAKNVGAAAITLPFLRSVGEALAGNVICEGDINIAEGVLHLIKSLFIEPPVAQTSTRRSPEEIMHGIRATIEEHLGDPDMTPEMIARMNYVSTSYLHKLFHKYEGVSMGAWVRAARLRRCHRDLTDPDLASRKVIEIASDWGFPTASHFSRAFRSAYGYSPRQLRRDTARING